MSDCNLTKSFINDLNNLNNNIYCFKYAVCSTSLTIEQAMEKVGSDIPTYDAVSDLFNLNNILVKIKDDNLSLNNRILLFYGIQDKSSTEDPKYKLAGYAVIDTIGLVNDSFIVLDIDLSEFPILCDLKLVLTEVTFRHLHHNDNIQRPDTLADIIQKNNPSGSTAFNNIKSSVESLSDSDSTDKKYIRYYKLTESEVLRINDDKYVAEVFEDDKYDRTNVKYNLLGYKDGEVVIYDQDFYQNIIRNRYRDNGEIFPFTLKSNEVLRISSSYRSYTEITLFSDNNNTSMNRVVIKANMIGNNNISLDGEGAFRYKKDGSSVLVCPSLTGNEWRVFRIIASPQVSITKETSDLTGFVENNNSIRFGGYVGLTNITDFTETSMLSDEIKFLRSSSDSSTTQSSVDPTTYPMIDTFSSQMRYSELTKELILQVNPDETTYDLGGYLINKVGSKFNGNIRIIFNDTSNPVNTNIPYAMSGFTINGELIIDISKSAVTMTDLQGHTIATMLRGIHHFLPSGDTDGGVKYYYSESKPFTEFRTISNYYDMSSKQSKNFSDNILFPEFIGMYIELINPYTTEDSNYSRFVKVSSYGINFTKLTYDMITGSTDNYSGIAGLSIYVNSMHMVASVNVFDFSHIYSQFIIPSNVVNSSGYNSSISLEDFTFTYINKTDYEKVSYGSFANLIGSPNNFTTRYSF